MKKQTTKIEVRDGGSETAEICMTFIARFPNDDFRECRRVCGAISDMLRELMTPEERIAFLEKMEAETAKLRAIASARTASIQTTFARRFFQAW
jgi:hypothetical protein